jgi:hypothetical protein
MARLLIARGMPREVWWIRAVASSENSGSDRPASVEVVGDVGGGLGRGEPVEVEPQPDALVEGGEVALLQTSAEGGLAEQDQPERAAGVHVGVGQQPQLFELLDGEQVGFVDDEHDGLAAFAGLGGEQVGGLGDQGGPVELGDVAECGDQVVVDAAGADHGVGQVDDGEPGGVEGRDAGAGGEVLPAPTSPVTTPMAVSSISQRSRATASLWVRAAKICDGAIERENGVRDSP